MNPPSYSSTALTRSSDRPEKSLNRQNVLDEDDYQDGLAQIIARDFFPSLVHLEASNNYLTALETQDPTLIHASVRRLTDLASAPTPISRRSDGATPYVQFPSDTPLRTPHPSSQPPSKRPRYDSTLSLDQFQARYTSEDNASFTEILQEENQRRKEKHAWAWNAEDRAHIKKSKEIEGRKQLLIQATSSSANQVQQRITMGSGSSTSLFNDTATTEVYEDPGSESDESEAEVMQEILDEPIVKKARKPKPVAETPEQNSMALVVSTPETALDAKPKETDEPPIDVMAPLKDTRSTTIPGWRFKARNALMFGPGADDSPYDPSGTTDVQTKPGATLPSIAHANTRLPQQSEAADEPPSPTRSRVAAAIAGDTSSVSDTPKVRGFGFVEAMPSPNADEFSTDQLKQLITWGTLQGTPRLLSSSDDPADSYSPFVINAPNARDSLGRRLGNEAGRSLTKKANLLGGTPKHTPSNKRPRDQHGASTPRRTEMLTPAARRLLEKTKSTSSLGRLNSPIASGRSLGGASTPGITPVAMRGKELDLRKIGWSPRETPRHVGGR